MRLTGFLVIFVMFFCSRAIAYAPLTDDKNGGNPVLDKKIYKVYIQADPTGNKRDEEVKNAANKWKDELAKHGVTLEVQAGAPPQTPTDLNKLNQEIEKFNKDPNPDLENYPEIAKSEAKKCTINVYWETTADIIKRGGGGSERGMARSIWNFDDKGKADKIESSDVFMPTDPPGVGEEVKKRITHNIAMHEMGHVAGFDHYTEAQEKTGDIMEKDATLHGTKLDLSDEEKKGLKSFYSDNKSSMKVDDSAHPVDLASLSPEILETIPADVLQVYEYTYGIEWLSGEEISYFQIETQGFPVYFSTGEGALEDWLIELPERELGENYLKVFADSNYLDELNSEGQLQLYSDAVPGEGWLVYSTSNALRGAAPVPEPATFVLFLNGMLGLGIFSKRFPGVKIRRFQR